jgi:hypothetical protein
LRIYLKNENKNDTLQFAIQLTMESKCVALTTEIDLGRIVSHTRPVNILVTANPSVNKSALDCELPLKKKGLSIITLIINKDNILRIKR